MTDRTTDDADRIALGLDPIEDTPRPVHRARAIAAALWAGRSLHDSLARQCALATSPIPQLRQQSVFFQTALGALLDAKDTGRSLTQALRSHDWDALWNECGD